MKEKPILFSAPMVRAILDGRKTQTRRKMNPHPNWGRAPHWDGSYDCFHDGIMCSPNVPPTVTYMPNYAKGDRLWVRETFRLVDGYYGRAVDYRATDTSRCIRWPADDYDNDGRPEGVDSPEHESEPIEDAPWKPSIFMPRWASRITLEVTDVRVERLQDITEADARAEGMNGPLYVSPTAPDHTGMSPLLAFSLLWESINGAGSWDANPWVWAYTFKVVK